MLEAAELILSAPDFEKACENIAAERRSRLMHGGRALDGPACTLWTRVPFDDEDIPEPKEGESGAC